MLQHLLFAAALSAPPIELSYDQTVQVVKDGKPAASQTAKVFWSGRRVRLESDDSVLLLDLERGRAVRLFPSERVAQEVDVERLRTRSQLDLSSASNVMESGDDFRATPLRTPRTIAGYACQGYRLKAGGAVVDVFLSSKVPLGIGAFAEFLEWSGAELSLPGLVEALRRLRGFPMETRTRVTADGHAYETISTITRLKLGAQPAALFEVPASYKLEAEPGDEP